MALSIAISLLFDISLLFGISFVVTLHNPNNTATQQYGPLYIESFYEASYIGKEEQKKVPKQQSYVDPDKLVQENTKKEAEISVSELDKKDGLQDIQGESGIPMDTSIRSSTELEPISNSNYLSSDMRNTEESIKAWLYRQISQHLVYPPIARKRSIEGTSRISFTIDPTGHLIAMRIDTSAGNVILDNAALALIKSIFPIPETLCTMHKDISFTIDITYALK
ncbi:energy transducer TonB family protein [Gracilinema caldarium]|uniref:TonB family protein n=1 Tax=Gracilinema caldarium (strain ATCC 51460 / DSM 7334 / H1) TaxID=744872 RepID=F8EY37_GRAC1|nr:TonB family protein [Gracilinema caldarium]AEJ20698.1 TonB family protein [Gracilinema caldarium DSM 7334]